MLAGFLAAFRALDPDDLDHIPLASRLSWAAYRAGQEMAHADAGWSARRRDLDDGAPGPELPSGHPDFVLAAAVREGSSPPPTALIGANRLKRISLSRLAAETRISHSALCNRRKKAEKAITDAIKSGFSAD